MTVFTFNKKHLNGNQMIFCQLLFMLPAIIFYAQAIFHFINGFSIPIFKLYQAIWLSSLLFSLYLSYKIVRNKQIATIKIISVCLALISLYFLLINLHRPFYLIRDVFEFLADFFGFIGDLISGKVH